MHEPPNPEDDDDEDLVFADEQRIYRSMIVATWVRFQEGLGLPRR
jgi:hypothetical protein